MLVAKETAVEHVYMAWGEGLETREIANISFLGFLSGLCLAAALVKTYKYINGDCIP